MSTIPILILVRPQMGENIGAVARAMSNFGLEELRIVAPRDGWPNPKATEMAAGAESIIADAKIYDNFTDSMLDIHAAYATTARPRDMNKRAVSPEIAMREISAALTPKVAIVFGPERTGLENEEITLCDSIISIPTSEKNRSLNLAQSSVIIGYEWLKVQQYQNTEIGKQKSENFGEHSAPKSDMLGLFEQLEEYLDKSEYFRTENKKPIMWQNLKNMLLRGAWSEQEIRTFRGVIRSLWERSTKDS